MTTDRQIAANRQNALSSTGPRTTRGKAVASRNNTRHGLRATTPVIPRLESPEDWERHRAVTVAGLTPATVLEEALAERVALLLWRLDRVARYERDVTSQSQDHAAADLQPAVADDGDLADVRQRYNTARRQARVLASLSTLPADAHISGKDADAALTAIGAQVPNAEIVTFYAPDIIADHLQFEQVPDWTVARVMQFVAAFAAAHDRDPDQLRADALAEAQCQHNAERVTCRRLTRQLHDLRRERILPQHAKLDQIVRYERHLMSQLNQTLGHLKQLQHQRESSRRRASDDDYHRPYDYYDTHPTGGLLPATAPVPAPDLPPLPDNPSHHAATGGLPLSLARAVGTSAQPMFAPRSGGGPMVGVMRGSGGEGLPGSGGEDFPDTDSGHSNPIDSEDAPGAAPDCATPAPDCAPPDPAAHLLAPPPPRTP